MLTLVLISLALLSPVVVMALYIDDWSRDLTTNRAATAVKASDPRQRPLTLAAQSDAPMINRALEAFASERPEWSLVDPLDPPADSPLASEISGKIEQRWSLVRTTALMRYRDDLWLVAERLDDGRLRVHAESRSRIGKGDLGQNPRNLRELMAALKDHLPQQ
ncbi:hypothetical protein Pla111_15030 [Botrimarina hoheduenensis]|uniref:DUF1499 domain-containing protein n=2 Tax=Botrimarina hoheduenensis TaxID=2528000 RepID=A0A5C5W7I9_9BACT|nr:hypothetical protein Pla111_15030 [Botrimarina hoheduenensis]